MILRTFQHQKTPLHLAVQGNDRDVAELLLQSGADVNVKDVVNRAHIYEINLLLLVVSDINIKVL